MKKINFPMLFAACYECLRILFILSAQEAQTNTLPLSWYAAVPLLSIPFMLCLRLLFDANIKTETKHACLRTLSLIHLLSVISLAAYLMHSITGAFHHVPFAQANAKNNLPGILFFLPADGIFSFVFHISAKKTDTDNDVRTADETSSRTENIITEGTLCK
ncbi:MAG: hypothetical protein NC041_05990 [Bacteroides sp.]|nr:hypothetical protein [Prevotella sp.]MCM1407507.1 hypothetical protein [Treponema brennaborense]MCM1469997.1 hypothetical protein [Bacteroides sp.]